jgi:outer membrane receptor protein involved in Fe transport
MDVSHMERVEIIRGPASVLYGSEAIGGVINMITRAPQYGSSGTQVFGQLGYRYGSADSQNKAFAEISGYTGNLAFQLSGTYRNAGSYYAPGGSFGNITLDGKTPVNDTGVEDYSLNMFLGYRFGESNDLSVKFESYNASDSGFGYVDPDVYDPNAPFIRLSYPDHKMQKFTLKYENRALKSFLADGITFLGYTLGNKRTFNTDISIAFSPMARMDISSSNYTDVNTIGGRLELTKVLWKSHIFTYGADFYVDDSQNTDSSTTTIFGFGPPIVSNDSLASVPNATLQSFGLYLQDDISIFQRASVILGVRYQNVRAQTKSTPGWEGEAVDSTDSTMVAAANLLYNFTDNLNIFVSLGRGFRSPNLPERFFVGTTPDGGGYQIGNPNLKAETSFNTDLGLRFHKGSVFVEASYFRNLIYDGIQIVPTGNMVGRLPEYQNVNIEELRLQGLELQGSFSVLSRITLSANYSYITSKNLTNPELAFADTYGSRLNVIGRYSLPGDWAWLEYHVRHNWDQKDVNLIANPVGDIIPGFTVHSLRGGFTLFKNSRFPQTIGIIVNNLTNTLYSEFTNASFFRPAPERHVVLTWSARF